jgi:hypothetical protein
MNLQSEPLVSVLITNYNTYDFVKLSLFALKSLTHNSYKVLINDNGSRKKDISMLQKITQEEKNVFVNFRKSKYEFKDQSFAHAEALDILINMVDTKYTVILDSDCILLMKNWDQYLINQINDKVKIIGAPLPPGRSGLKPYDFPFQFAVLFETETYKKLKISCMPCDISKGKDTCWEWKPKFTNNGYEAGIFIVKNTRDFKDGPFGNVLCEEYYVDDNRLIASHFGRGSSGGTVKLYGKWYFNLLIVSKFIKRVIAYKQKNDWINKCYKIIREQSSKKPISKINVTKS